LTGVALAIAFPKAQVPYPQMNPKTEKNKTISSILM
jgi:hypothetical protein